MENKQQTAVDSIIEFCQKQMDNDSSIHKGVYLSIIKFCKEQITEESEIHWKTTLVTMTNNKQQTPMEWFIEQLEEKGDLRETPSIRNIQLNIDTSDYMELKQQAKAMQKQQAEHYATFITNCVINNLPTITFNDWINLHNNEQQ